MNIYLHLEISARELDSKLLLAILAAARGHEVVVANIEVLETWRINLAKETAVRGGTGHELLGQTHLLAGKDSDTSAGALSR